MANNTRFRILFPALAGFFGGIIAALIGYQANMMGIKKELKSREIIFAKEILQKQLDKQEKAFEEIAAAIADVSFGISKIEQMFSSEETKIPSSEKLIAIMQELDTAINKYRKKCDEHSIKMNSKLSEFCVDLYYRYFDFQDDINTALSRQEKIGYMLVRDDFTRTDDLQEQVRNEMKNILGYGSLSRIEKN